MKGHGRYTKPVKIAKTTRTARGPRKPPSSYKAAGARVLNNGSRLNKSPRSR